MSARMETILIYLPICKCTSESYMYIHTFIRTHTTAHTRRHSGIKVFSFASKQEIRWSRRSFVALFLTTTLIE